MYRTAMIITVIRGLILYILITLCMRLMGKRHLGELQPTELVITILLSEIAAIPMENNETPIINSVLAVLLLVALEIISSVICMKFPHFRYLIQGNSAVIVRNGVIDQKMLKKLRYTADDLLDALRQKDIFDLEKIQYAIIETNGSLSVKLKSGEEPVTADLLKIPTKETGLPCIIINDGKILSKYLEECDMSQKDIKIILKEQNTDMNEILVMLADGKGEYKIIKKDKDI